MSYVVSRIGDGGYHDYPTLLALILRAFAYMDPLIDPPSSAHRLTVKSLEQKARDEIGLAITQDDQLLACAFLRPEEQCLYIGKLAVDPAAQGRGLGALLLGEAQRIAEDRRLAVLRLETRIELVGNHRLFAKWGFHKSVEGRHAGYDRPTFIEMQKRLS